MTKKRIGLRYIRLLFIMLVSFLLLVGFSGCQTVDKDGAELKTSNDSPQIEYNESSNTTKVVWTGKLTNDTIYDINEFSVTFRLYEGTTAQTETYTYKGTKQGETLTGNFQFHAEGKIDSIEWVSWEADYDTFWETYRVAIFITLGVAVLAAIVYIVVMIIEDFDLEDVIGWLLLSAILPISGFISTWVLAFIIAGGVLLAFAIILIAHGIRALVE